MNKKPYLAYLAASLLLLVSITLFCFKLDSPFVLKGIIRTYGIIIPFPLTYLSVLVLYSYILARLYKIKIMVLLKNIFPLGIIFSLLFLLVGMIGAPVFGPNNAMFNFYSTAYIALVLSISCILVLKNQGYFSDIIRPQLNTITILLTVYTLYRALSEKAFVFLSIYLCLLICLYIISSSSLIMNRLRKFLSSKYLFILSIFILAFAIRAYWGLRLISITGDQFYTASDDGLTYGAYAESWANGQNSPALGTFGGFGYWYFLGWIYRLFGIPNYQAAVLIQAFLGAMVPIFIFYLGKMIANKQVARISALITCLNSNLIFNSVIIGMEALFIPLVFFILFLLIKFIQKGLLKRNIIYSLLIGLLIGVANVVRGELLFVPLLLLLVLIFFGRKLFSLKDIARISSGVFIGFLVIMLAFCCRNLKAEGRFDFRTDQAAISFNLVENKVRETHLLSDMGFNPFQSLSKSWDTFKSQPGTVAKLMSKGMWKKGINYFFCPNFGELDFLTITNPSAIPTYKYPLYMRFYIYIFLILGCYIFIKKREHFFERILLSSYILYTILIYAVVMSTNARHRGILEPLLIIIFVNGIYSVIKKIRA